MIIEIRDIIGEDMAIRAFDLNIEEVLENWEVEHALREAIANALDGQVISKTAEIEIAKDRQGDGKSRDTDSFFHKRPYYFS